MRASAWAPPVAAIGLVAFAVASCADTLTIKGPSTANACQASGGVWYNTTCWQEFDGGNLSESEVAEYVNESVAILKNLDVTLNGESFDLRSSVLESEGDAFLAIIGFEKGDEIWSLVAFLGEEEAETTLFSVDMSDDAVLESLGNDLNDEILGSGVLELAYSDDETEAVGSGVIKGSNGEDYRITFSVNEALAGYGNTTFDVQGTEAMVNGTLGTVSYFQLQELIRIHPEVTTLVLRNVPGSVNDAVNMHTGRLVRSSRLNTKVLADSQIASGGVDLFTAGNQRFVEPGARIGVHSWCCIEDLTANEAPREHPAHAAQLAYFTATLGKERGPAFYFYTLEAAEFDDIHWMSDEEITRWGLATQ